MSKTRVIILSMKHKKIIALTGFPLTGKTSLGKKLAKVLGWTFIDLDEYICSTTGHSPANIIINLGEPAFRNLEHQALQDVLRQPSPSVPQPHKLRGLQPHSTVKPLPAVLSLGGGCACYQKNLGLLLNNTTLIYLKVPLNTILRRLKQANPAKRPLLLNKSPQQIKELYHQRLPFYNKAHIVCNIHKTSSQKALEIITNSIAASKSKNLNYR